MSRSTGPEHRVARQDRPIAAKRRRRRPVWSRGRAGRFWGGLRDYALIAWWGIVRPRVSERRPLELSQAVVLRARPGAGPGREDLEVLLSIRRDLFGWELPGGTIESGEGPQAALVREVREETGLVVAVEAHVGDWVRQGFRPHRSRVYRCRVVGGTLRPSHETPRVGWFDAANPPDELFPWYRELLACALDDQAPTVHREWQGLTSIVAALRIDFKLRWQGLPADPAKPLLPGSRRE